MKPKSLILIVLALIGLNSVILGQQKYAVLIAGDNYAENVPFSDQWNQGAGMGQYGFDEFWNDCFLFWELLYTKEGYSNENIYVLYADGNDLTFYLQAERYQSMPTYGFNITDQAATKANIHHLFTITLPSFITQDDFLYVWIISHGGNTNSDNNGDAYFYTMNGELIYDYELAEWTDNIVANRKVFHLQFPKAGGFGRDLQNDNTYIYTSCNNYESSFRADNYPVSENEVISNITYNHGEFNFHTYSALNGQTPAYSSTYNSQPLSDANADENEFISFGESKFWNDSQHTTTETPESFGDIGLYSALDYPTLFIEDFYEDA
jgi:hypothetical protein